jgi:hypothetical protein
VLRKRAHIQVNAILRKLYPIEVRIGLAGAKPVYHWDAAHGRVLASRPSTET